MRASHLLPDFDTLVELHQTDPISFEQTRSRVLQAAIDDTPAEHRHSLEILLGKIDAARASAETTADAVTGAFHMMCDSVGHLCDAWDKASIAAAEWQTALVIERAKGSW